MLLLYAAALTAACLWPIRLDPGPPPPFARRALNNLLHVPAYALLAYLAGLQARRLFRSKSAAFGAGMGGAAALIHGGLTEWLQTFVEGRVCAWGDLGLNAVGVSAGILVLLARWRYRVQSGGMA